MNMLDKSSTYKRSIRNPKLVTTLSFSSSRIQNLDGSVMLNAQIWKSSGEMNRRDQTSSIEQSVNQFLSSTEESMPQYKKSSESLKQRKEKGLLRFKVVCLLFVSLVESITGCHVPHHYEKSRKRQPCTNQVDCATARHQKSARRETECSP